MVPMRSLKFKFEEGEKVLCYEPDPTKARVLYDSKVLEVSVNKDKKGRKCVEYLIHFQGWNSSWDRYVSEDHILKHTEENWKLQKELAEKAQLRPTAYLYRRDLKGTKGSEIYRTSNKVEQRSSHQGLAPTSSRDSSPNTHSSHSTVSDKDENSRRRNNTRHRRKRERSVMEDEQLSNDCADNLDSDIEFGIKNEIESIASEEGHSDVEEDDDDDEHTHIRSGDQDSDFVDNNNTDNSDSSIEEDVSEDDADDVSYSEEGTRGYIEEENFPLEFSEAMKDILDLDNELIKNGSKLVSLPANPNVVNILESYVKEYAINQICGAPENSRRKHRRHHNHHNGPLDIERINRCINICKEVADGVRIYFDFTLSGLLLYNEERDQYEHIHRMNIKKEQESRVQVAFDNVGENVFHQSNVSYSCEPSTSHLDELSYEEKYDCSSSLNSHPRPLSSTDVESRDSLPLEAESEKNDAKNTDACAANGSFYFLVMPKKEPLSPKSKVASIINNPLKHTILGTTSDLSSLEDVLRSRGCPPASLKFLLSQVLEWRLVPESWCIEGSLPPSLIYGAIHLARLFVKLPGLLHNTDMQARKLKLVLRHLQMILRYLEQNNSWFGEEFYFDTPGQKIE